MNAVIDSMGDGLCPLVDYGEWLGELVAVNKLGIHIGFHEPHQWHKDPIIGVPIVKVKPEDMRLANTVAGIKESGNTQKKFYWNGVHKLVMMGDKLCLKTTDGSVWLDWFMPTEGDPVNINVIVTQSAFEAPAKYMEGGSLELQSSNGVITLKKGQFTYPLIHQQAIGEYPEPLLGDNPVAWTCESRKLSKALKFVAGFVDETHPNANKSVATIRRDGSFLSGSPKKCAILRGLTSSTEMSFKARIAKAVSTFLDRIGDTVQISVTETTYTFTDPDAKHRLVVLAEAGRFPPVAPQMTARLKEVTIIDRKTLLLRCLAFAGAMKEGQDRINLTFKGCKEHASLKVWTPGEGNDIAQDEFSVYRTVPEKDGETATAKEERIAALGRGDGVEMSFNRQFLADTLQAMEGTSVTYKSDGQRFALVEDEMGTGEEANKDPSKTVLLTASQRGEVDDPAAQAATATNGQPVAATPAPAVRPAAEPAVVV